MTLSYSVLQNQWLILTFGIGLALLAFFTLAYIGYWRPRRDGQPAATVPLRRALPWFLIVLYVAMAAYAAGFAWLVIRRPPNW